MKVLIGRTVAAHTDPIATTLTASGVDAADYGTDLSALADHLQREPDDRCLLCYSRPEYAVARAMILGEDVAAAVDQWTEQARAVADLYVQNRANCILVDCLNASARPKQFATLMKSRLGVSINGDQTTALCPTPEPLPTYAVLAAQWPANSQSVSELAGQLEACADPLGDGGPEYTSPPDKSYAVYKNVLSDNGTLGNNKELEEENELLILQLHQVQEELERYYLDTIDLKEDLAKAQEQLETATARLPRLESETTRLQRDLTTIRSEKDSLHAQARELAKYALAMEKMADHFLRSTSWKVTVPIRVIGRFIKRVLRRKRVSRSRFPERPHAMTAYGPGPVGRPSRRKK
ncbi:MAG: hypothetical protein ACOCU9_02435 [Spirochaetota bacterium]